MKQVIQEIQEWAYIGALPKELHGFVLEVQLKEKDNKYNIWRYSHPSKRRSFSLIYDKATKEFIARTTIGLTEFCDINYICPNLEVLGKILSERLDLTIRNLAVFDVNSLESSFIEKGITDWTYGQNLPKKIDQFELYVEPKEPVKVINGSYIIIDYSDFNAKNSLIIYYNVFRDEFFGELRLNLAPEMIADFDAKTLLDLETKVVDRLETVLKAIK